MVNGSNIIHVKENNNSVIRKRQKPSCMACQQNKIKTLDASRRQSVGNRAVSYDLLIPIQSPRKIFAAPIWWPQWIITFPKVPLWSFIYEPKWYQSSPRRPILKISHGHEGPSGLYNLIHSEPSTQESHVSAMRKWPLHLHTDVGKT